jgi:SAM-dependent methyltransferase
MPIPFFRTEEFVRIAIASLFGKSALANIRAVRARRIGMQTIANIDELVKKLKECEEAGKISDDRLREVFNSFKMDFSLDVPEDPFSPEYAAHQMKLYEQIAGRRYAIENEVTKFDTDSAVHRPFPYYTGSCSTAGFHLSAMGFLLRVMHLKPGARILEFGPGWGNTTMALAKLGFDVTAVDIEENFCELLRRRARNSNLNINVVNDSFFYVETVTEPFDSIIFFECFHHCSDHLRLLKSMYSALNCDGQVYFGSEPILPDFPLPWGLRMDGESLWAIRSNGWLELGFREDYFRRALRKTGWMAQKHTSGDLGWVTVWKAWKNPVVVEACDPRLRTRSGNCHDGAIHFMDSPPGRELWGPYIALGQGAYVADLHLRHGAKRSGEIIMDVCAAYGDKIFAASHFDLGRFSDSKDMISLSFDLEHDYDDVEVRLTCKSCFTGCIERLEISFGTLE